MNLRRHAKGKPCQIRIPGICSHNCQETVLAHIRLAGVTGVGMKAPDILGAWACAKCHSLVDSHNGDDMIQRAFYEGVMRTQDRLIAEGLLKW